MISDEALPDDAGHFDDHLGVDLRLVSLLRTRPALDLPDWTHTPEASPMTQNLLNTLTPPSRSAQQAEHARRSAASAGYSRPERYARSGSKVYRWAAEHMDPSDWQQLVNCRHARQQAAAHYSRFGHVASPEPTGSEYRLALRIASQAGCSFDDALAIVFA